MNGRDYPCGQTYAIGESPVGWLGVISGSGGLVEIAMLPDKNQILSRIRLIHPHAVEKADGDAALRQIEEFFRGERRQFDLVCDFANLSAFAIIVLRMLPDIPYGSTVTYGDLAVRAGNPGAARAVGRIMALNPFPLVLPCHRVVGAGGRLTGYSGGGGISTKEWLLDFECSRADSAEARTGEKTVCS